MFHLIRQIHLFTAFVLTTFVLMYFVTGFVVIEERFQRKDNAVTATKKVVPGIRQLRGDSLVAVLEKNFDVRGQYQIRTNSVGTSVGFRHPGVEIAASFSRASDSVTVIVKEKNFVNVLHQFHRLHGYYGGWNYMLWAILFDLSSVAMIVFAFTGVYLWYKTERNKLPGWLILGAFTVFTAYTLVYLTYLE